MIIFLCIYIHIYICIYIHIYVYIEGNENGKYIQRINR
jgi:hypothetical protein